jgi:signal peptidase II
MICKRKNILFLAVTFGLIFFDQLSKYLIRHSGGFYICNKGIAFGLELHPIFFWIIWLLIIAIVSSQIFNFKFSIFNQFSINKFTNFKFLGLVLILSGAMSNVVDRLLYGCIIDFVELKFWPVFNLADVFICAGVILILISNLKFKI